MKVLSYPNPVLFHKCKPVTSINQQLRDLIAEMLQTMYEFRGVGLAANQVGYPIQLFVMNETGDFEKPENEYVFINPVILKRKGNQVDQEGCLSFPEIYANVNRAELVEIESIAIDGSIQKFQWKDRPATIVQHEYDHLNGICFVDRLSELSLHEIREELADLKINYEGDVRLGFTPSAEETKKRIADLEKQFCE
ncbi:MAG: peptide deformylase [Planctomycetaceae bacterium]|nr:peptide deformylase [Planctomycetaceae bacterium]